MTLMKMRWRILMMVVMVMMGGMMNTGLAMRKQLSQASDVTGLRKECGMIIKDYWRQDRRKDGRERNWMTMNLIAICIFNPTDQKWKKFIVKTQKTEDGVQNKIQNGSTYNDQHILQQSQSPY